jgi:hypothetical protein
MIRSHGGAGCSEAKRQFLPSARRINGICPTPSAAGPFATSIASRICAISEFVLTRWGELPIVRPPFGKSNDFLESIPSKFLSFPKVAPRPVLSTSRQDSTTGNRCRYSRGREPPTPSKGSSKMKRLSLLLVAFAFLASASGCCCGLFHGCNSCGYPQSSPCGCGYAPGYQAYPMAPSCPTCPTCPGGGCGVNGPVMQQGAFYDGNSAYGALSSNAGYGATPAASLAAAERQSTF